MKKLLFVLAIGCGMVATKASAAGLGFSIGHTSASSSTTRLGLVSEFKRAWWVSERGQLSGYWNAGYTYWNGRKSADNHSLSISPVWRYSFNQGLVRPYIEAGIGVALFHKTRIERRRLGSALQFEDRLGFGVQRGMHELGVQVVHYSNGGLKKPNAGIENYSVHYRLNY